jgi:tetratricopeptide (TPR) repeat protein
MKIKAFFAAAAPVFLACALGYAEERGAAQASGQGEQEQRLGGSQTGSKASGDARDLYLRGEAALQSGDLDAAEKAFRQVLAIDPRSAGAYSNLGVIAMRRKDWDHALKLLDTAAKLAPTVSGVRLNIGLVYYREGDYAAAIAPLSSVVREQPGSEQARYLLGLCDVFTQKFTDAVTVLEPLWGQKSDDFMYLYVLSMAANGAGRKELDEKALARLIEVGGDRAEFHLLLGKAYLYRQETEKAVAEFEHAASLEPNLPFVHFNLGIAYMRSGDSRRAEEEFRRDIGIEPELPDNYEVLGEFYMREGKDDEAENSFHEALRLNARMPGAHYGIAKIYLRQVKYQEALTAVDAALRFAPSSQSVHYLRGQILAKLGRKEESRAEFAAVDRMAASSSARQVESFDEGRVPNPELTQQPPQ